MYGTKIKNFLSLLFYQAASKTSKNIKYEYPLQS